MRAPGVADGVDRADPARTIERCYREQRDRLWRALLLFTRDPELASDSMAEAFAQLLRRGDAVNDPAGWVWRAAFRIARGELKRRPALSDVADRAIEMPEPAVDVIRAIKRLSPRQRAVLVLRYYAGYSTRETAAIIGSTAPAVAVHLQRACVRLRELLEVSDG